MRWGKAKKSYYRMLFSNLLLAFAVPVVIAAVIICTLQVRQEVAHSQDELAVDARRLSGVLESQMSSALRVSYHCANDTYIASLSKKAYDVLEFAPLSESLVRLKAASAYIDDILVYYENVPMVYTANGIYPVARSVTSLLVDGQQLDEFLAEPAKYFTFTRASISRAGQTKDSIIYTYRDDMRPSIRVLVTFQPQTLGFGSDSFANDLWLVRAKGGHVLLATEKCKDMQMDAFLHQDNDVMTLDGERYLAAQTDSDQFELSYIVLRPMTDILPRIISSMGATLAVIMLLVVLAIGVILRVTNRAYAPVDELYKATAYGPVPQKTDEFGQISHAISAMQQDITQKEQSLQRQLPAVRMHLLSQLINGMYSSVDDFRHAAEPCGITLRWNHFILLMTASELQPAEQVIQAVEEGAGDACDIFGCPTMSPKRQVFIMSLPGLEDADGLLTALHGKLTQQLGMITLYVSDGVQDFSHISQAAAECLNLMNTYGRNAKLNRFQPDVQEAELLRSISGNCYPYLHQLYHCVCEADLEGANTCLDKLEAEYTHWDMTPYVAQCLSYELITRGVQAVRQLLNQQETAASTQNLELLDNLYGIRSLSQATGKLRSIFAEVLTPLRPADPKREKPSMEEILRFIQTNYRNYDFSVKQVAEFAGLSLPGISQYFKAQRGMTVIDYVLQLRIQAAKNMLANTDMLISEIVNAIGYVSVPSFVSKFKRVTGMTPGEYRSMPERQKEEPDVEL